MFCSTCCIFYGVDINGSQTDLLLSTCISTDFALEMMCTA